MDACRVGEVPMIRFAADGMLLPGAIATEHARAIEALPVILDAIERALERLEEKDAMGARAALRLALVESRGRYKGTC